MPAPRAAIQQASTDIAKVTTDLNRSSSHPQHHSSARQIQSMNDAFRDMAIGLLFAAVFVIC